MGPHYSVGLQNQALGATTNPPFVRHETGLGGRLARCEGGGLHPSAAPPQPKVRGAMRDEGGAALSSVGSLQPAAITAALFATRTANIKQLLAKAA